MCNCLLCDCPKSIHDQRVEWLNREDVAIYRQIVIQKTGGAESWEGLLDIFDNDEYLAYESLWAAYDKFFSAGFHFSIPGMMLLNGMPILSPIECECDDDGPSVTDAEQTNQQFNAAAIAPFASPLILDLDGDGLETYGANTSEVRFDHDGDGLKYTTGWVGADDGLLVFDRNNDGLINDGTELFGDHTLKYDGSGEACANGFEALAQEDSNGDGVIDENDDNWANLRVWRDLDQDGVTDEGELFTLGELGITSLNTAYTPNGTAQANGNYLFGAGSYTTEDDETHLMADMFFSQDTFKSEFTDPIEVPDAIQDSLPNLGGAGAVRSLWEACVLNDDLADILAQYSAADTRAAQMALIDELLLAWAGTSGLTDNLADRVAGRYNLTVTVDSGVNRTEWERKIHILEAFNGRYFFALPDGLAEFLN